MSRRDATRLQRRRVLAGAAALLLPAAGVRADAAWPSKAVRIVVQFQPGGSSDALARLLGEGLAQRLGQPVIVENRAGAGGIIGTDYVAKSPADGHTLLLTVPAPVIANIALYSKLPYDPRTDLRMVSDLAISRTVLAVHPSMAARDVRGLIDAVKKEPGKHTMGSWGPGTQPHMVQVYMDKTYGTRTLHVPYKGEAPMAMDLLSGVLTMTVGSTTTLLPHIQSGKLRAIAVAGPRRAKVLPDVPTFAEQGFPDEIFTLTGPTSLMAPAKTPDAVVDKLGRAVVAVMAEPAVRRKIEELGAEPVGNTPAEAAANYARLLPVLLRLTRDTGVTLD